MFLPLAHSPGHARPILQQAQDRLRRSLGALIGGAKQKAQKALREHMRDRLDSATQEDRRTILEALETRVTVGVGGLLEVSIGIPQGVGDCVHRTHGQ